MYQETPFSQSMKDSLPEQRKIGSAVPHPFDQLELVHKAFHLPIGVDHGYPSKHFLFVPLESGNETLYLAKTARLDLFHPVREPVPFTLANDLPEGLSQSMQRGKLPTGLAEFLEILSFLGIEVRRDAHEEPDRLLNGHAITHSRGRERHCFLIQCSHETIHRLERALKSLTANFLPQQ